MVVSIDPGDSGKYFRRHLDYDLFMLFNKFVGREAKEAEAQGNAVADHRSVIDEMLEVAETNGVQLNMKWERWPGDVPRTREFHPNHVDAYITLQYKNLNGYRIDGFHWVVDRFERG